MPTEAFSYTDPGPEPDGIITVLLPISTELTAALVRPTIIARYDAIDGLALEPADARGWYASAKATVRVIRS